MSNPTSRFIVFAAGMVVGAVIAGTTVHHLDMPYPEVHHSALAPKDPSAMPPFLNTGIPDMPGAGRNKDNGPGTYRSPKEMQEPPVAKRINPLPPSATFNPKDLTWCVNVVTRLTVPAGGTVWGTIKAQIIKNERDYPPADGHFLTKVELEEQTKRTVDELQARINADPSLKVRDLNRIPAGYQFDQAIDTSVSPVSGQ